METKVCNECNKELPLEVFTINSSVLSGYGGHCKPCHNKKNRKRHEERKTNPQYRASSLVRAAKQRCDNVSISTLWVEERIATGFCEATGLPFDMSPVKPARSFTPSLDRIDPKKGYTPENTQVVVWIYNRAKGVNNPEDVLTMAEALCKKSQSN